MKMSKLGLAVIATLSTLSTSHVVAAANSEASSIDEAIKNGKVSGTLQAYYLASFDDLNRGDSDILTLGLDLSYETATFYGFGAKATVQTSTAPWVTDAGKAEFNGDMYGEGSQLSEAYLSYTGGNTSAKVGRMYFWSPVLGGSGSRMTREAMQGIAIQNSDIPDTNVTLAYMTKFQSRTDGKGNIGEFTKTFGTSASPWGFKLEDGVYTVAVENKSIEDLTLTAAFSDGIDAFTVAYLESSYQMGNYNLATQFYSSKEDGEKRNELFGIQGTAVYGPVTLALAYTITGDDADVIPGVGNGADIAYTVSEVYGYQYNRGQQSTKATVRYDINDRAFIGSSVLFEDAKALQGRNNGDAYQNIYTAVMGGYRFSDSFDISAAYEFGGKDRIAFGSPIGNESEMRIKTNYSF